MKIYVNTGFGECLGADTAWIRDHGFSGIRQEIFRGEDAEPIIREIADAGREAILLLCGGHMERIAFGHTVELARHVTLVIRDLSIEPGRVAIEIGNEPDLACDQYKHHPESFTRLVRKSAAAIWRETPSMTVIAGAVCAAVFQLNDAAVDPPTSYEHRHGVRRQDGTAKPVATRIRAIAPELG